VSVDGGHVRGNLSQRFRISGPAVIIQATLNGRHSALLRFRARTRIVTGALEKLGVFVRL